MKKNYKMVLFICGVLIYITCMCLVIYAHEEEKTYTLYKTIDNTITCEVTESELSNYLNDSYEWAIEPTTLMYTADGRESWMLNSEVDMYKQNGWSIYPPIVIYCNGGEQSILQEDKEYYLSTGVWFETKEEAKPPVNITMNIFEKTNFSANELNQVLSKGLSGYGEAFYNMEQTYGINAIFAISVAELESGSGTSYSFKHRNNAFGIGPKKTFSSVESGINFFGQLMNKPLYYGKSIDKVGSIYCVGGNWANKVKTLMNNNYAELGY